VKRSRALLLSASVPFLPLTARAQAESRISAEQRASLTQLVAEASDEPQAIGFRVAIDRRGTIAYETARGKRTLHPDAPATVGTWYGIGSVTKQFTAALIMQLVEARRVRVDDRLASVLPSFPHASEITLRQLLTHTSGLPEYTAEAARSGLIDKPNVQPADLVALIASKALEFAPGTQWEYCNSNYLALGLVLEAAYGKPYAEVVRERLVVPLSLEVNPGPPASGEVAHGYTEGETPKPMTNPDASWSYAAGVLWATVRGIAAWNHALFSGRVVTPDSLAQMTTPAKLPSGKSTDYGFGLSVVSVHGHHVISHNGGVPGGFAAQNYVFPDDRFSIVTLANTIDFNAALPVPKLAEIFLPGVEAALRAINQERTASLDDPVIRAHAREWLDHIRSGTSDPHEMTPEMKAAWTPAAIKPAQELLGSAGTIRRLRLSGFALQGGYRIYVYDVAAASSHYTFTFVLDRQDRVAGLFVKP